MEYKTIRQKNAEVIFGSLSVLTQPVNLNDLVSFITVTQNTKVEKSYIRRVVKKCLDEYVELGIIQKNSGGYSLPSLQIDNTAQKVPPRRSGRSIALSSVLSTPNINSASPKLQRKRSVKRLNNTRKSVTEEPKKKSRSRTSKPKKK